MRTIPVCRAEFGLLIRYHVPWVHALPGPRRVEIERGMEALYPSATEYVIVQRGDDDERRGMPGWVMPKDPPMERFVPEPHEPQGVDCDVVVCPRKRNYGSSKNWPYWHTLTRQLSHEGYAVFAAGAPDSSYDVPCERAWDYTRFLDASIEAIRSAKLVVATDAGLAHLAVLCGAPLLIITYNGRVAPGAVLDPDGKELEPKYWPIRMEEYYVAANHTGSPIWTTPDWWFPKLVRDHTLAHLDDMAADD